MLVGWERRSQATEEDMEVVSPRLAADELAAWALTLWGTAADCVETTPRHMAQQQEHHSSSEDCHHLLCNMASANVKSTASCNINSRSQEEETSVDVGLLLLIALPSLNTQYSYNVNIRTDHIWYSTYGKREETVHVHDDAEATSSGGMVVAEGKKDWCGKDGGDGRRAEGKRGCW